MIHAFSINTIILTILGNYDDDINFTFGPDTEVEASCVSAFNGEMWVFGGTYHLRQVSGSYRENGENNIFRYYFR